MKNIKEKKLLSNISIGALLVLCVLCFVTFLSPLTVAAETSYHYIDASGNVSTTDGQSVNRLNTTQTSIGVSGATLWYVADGSLSISNNLDVAGTVHLILADGANISMTSISVLDGAKLFIYSQSTAEAQGKIRATRIYTKGTAETVINGGQITAALHNDNAAKLTINNGIIDAYDSDVAAIGAPTATGSGGTITINGGKIKAVGDTGIGAGMNGGGANITITGGTVEAYATVIAAFGPGIGGGSDVGSTNIKITGGSVTAIGGDRSPGIGLRSEGTGTVTISGGTVVAQGGAGASGIGNGWSSDTTVDVTITGGVVTATAGSNAAGIGGGERSAVGTITISGGFVTAKGFSDIGKGSNARNDGKLVSAENGTAIIVASTVDTDMSGFHSGLLIAPNGKLYGYSSFSLWFVIDIGTTLEIPAGSSITVGQMQNIRIAEGTTLINQGTITVKPGGHLENNGRIKNSGTISIESDPSASFYTSGTLNNQAHVLNLGTIYSAGDFRNAQGAICNFGTVSGVEENVYNGHPDADRNHYCDNGCPDMLGVCRDANYNHKCDYGCSKTYGTCGDTDFDHDCDYGCSRTYGTCEDTDFDHDCDYGCAKVHGTCEDTDFDHDCDYGCAKVHGTCEDADFDHDCDYGCSKTYGTCEDTDFDHACDYGCAKVHGTCEDADFDHDCDYGCSRTYGTCEDADFDHACDYGCAKVHGTCEDADFDHDCDYGCTKVHGTCEDTNSDHACDYGCTAMFGECADAENDNDHLCDYGCGQVLEDCSGGRATCTEQAICEICNEKYGALDEDNHSWNDGAVTSEPTCTEKGEKTYTCTLDGSHTYTEEIDATGHDMAPADCNNPSKCRNGCLHTEGEALGHTYDNACDASCNTCGATRTPSTHADADKNGICDHCDEAVKNDSTAVVIIVTVAITLAVCAAGVGAVYLIRKKKKS